MPALPTIWSSRSTPRRYARRFGASRKVANGVSRLLDAMQHGQRRGGDAVWALLNLELWYRTFIDNDGVQTLPERLPRAA